MLFQLDLVYMKFPMIKYCDEKLAPRLLLPFWKNRESKVPARPRENWKVHSYN